MLNEIANHNRHSDSMDHYTIARAVIFHTISLLLQFERPVYSSDVLHGPIYP